MSILVTGATGFIGSHLCKELVKKGFVVYGLSKTGDTVKVLDLLGKKNFHLIIGDIRNKKTVFDVIKNNDVKVVFHLAARLPCCNDFVNPFSCFDVNVCGTLNLLNAAYLYNVDYFLYSSTMGVYSVPPVYLPVDENHPVGFSTVYSVSKLSGEFFCNLYSKFFNVLILRFSGVYGPGQSKNNVIPRFFNQAFGNKPITVYGNGEQSSDFLYVKDAVKVILLAWTQNKTGVYNVGSGEEISVKCIARKIVKIFGSGSKTVLTSKDTDRPFRFYFDVGKLKNDFGFFPLFFDDGLFDYLLEIGFDKKVVKCVGVK